GSDSAARQRAHGTVRYPPAGGERFAEYAHRTAAVRTAAPRDDRADPSAVQREGRLGQHKDGLMGQFLAAIAPYLGEAGSTLGTAFGSQGLGGAAVQAGSGLWSDLGGLSLGGLS